MFMFNRLNVSGDTVLKDLFISLTNDQEKYLNLIIQASVERPDPVHIDNDYTML